MVAAIRKLTNTLGNSKHVWEEAEPWEKTAAGVSNGEGGLMERWGGGRHTRGQEGGREWLALVADAGSSKCSFEKTRLGRKTKD